MRISPGSPTPPHSCPRSHTLRRPCCRRTCGTRSPTRSGCAPPAELGPLRCAVLRCAAAAGRAGPDLRGCLPCAQPGHLPEGGPCCAGSTSPSSRRRPPGASRSSAPSSVRATLGRGPATAGPLLTPPQRIAGNWLVCLGMWQATAAQDIIGKLFGGAPPRRAAPRCAGTCQT